MIQRKPQYDAQKIRNEEKKENSFYFVALSIMSSSYEIAAMLTGATIAHKRVLTQFFQSPIFLLGYVNLTC